jgi:hypothetical protein
VRRHIKTVSGFAALTSGIVAIMLSAASASAKPSCYGDYCSGHSPVHARCLTGAREETRIHVGYYFVAGLFHTVNYEGYLELWWSPTCGTHWAEFVTTGSQRGMGPLQTWQTNGYHVSWSTDFSRSHLRYIGQMVYSRSRCAFAKFETGYGPVQTRCILN